MTSKKLNWSKIHAINKARQEKKQKLILKQNNANEVLKTILFDSSLYLSQIGKKYKDDRKQDLCEGIYEFLSKLDKNEIKVIFDKDQTKKQNKSEEYIKVDINKIDIAKDKDWIDSNDSKTLEDDFDLYSFMDSKFGNNVTWFALDEVGEANTILMIDDATAKISKIKLYDSREKIKNNGISLER